MGPLMAPYPLILIADDYLDSRDGYAKFLKFNGLRVILAADGERALTLAADEKPDVVVVDLGLPRIDGWEVLRRLKTDPWTKGIRVIVLTGHASRESHERAQRAGCDLFLTKPCLPDELLAAIRTLLPDDALRL